MNDQPSRLEIFAEIGINHNGDLGLAKKLIDVAKVSGADAVKFQKRNPDKCVPENQKNLIRKTPWGEITYLEYRHKVEFGMNEYVEIDRYCKSREIEWFASVWDLDSLKFVMEFRPRKLKIPSALITNEALIEGVARSKVHTYLSTGMSTLEEIDKAVETFKKFNSPLTLMHCTSSYPAPNAELNLNCINFLKNRYGCPVGYSGHEYGLVASMAAATLGAVCIERHITLDHQMWGTDHQASVEPAAFIKLVRYIRSISEAMGDGVKRVFPSEVVIREKLRGNT